MLTRTISKELTFTFTTMESLIPQIPSNPHQYFLEFASKEEYLEKRAEWRRLYKWLSKAIRHNKRVCRANARASSMIEHRMVKAQKLPGYGYVHPHYCSRQCSEESVEEYRSRLNTAKSSIPQRIKTERLDATNLLKVRQLMKEESIRQREK